MSYCYFPNNIGLDIVFFGSKRAAYKSGVSIYTIKNIIAGRMVNPTIGTLTAPQDFCDQKDEEKEESIAAHMEEQNKSTFYNFS